jgi:hypothetical protein
VASITSELLSGGMFHLQSIERKKSEIEENRINFILSLIKQARLAQAEHIKNGECRPSHTPIDIHQI